MITIAYPINMQFGSDANVDNRIIEAMKEVELVAVGSGSGFNTRDLEFGEEVDHSDRAAVAATNGRQQSFINNPEMVQRIKKASGIDGIEVSFQPDDYEDD